MWLVASCKINPRNRMTLVIKWQHENGIVMAFCLFLSIITSSQFYANAMTLLLIKYLIPMRKISAIMSSFLLKKFSITSHLINSIEHGFISAPNC